MKSIPAKAVTIVMITSLAVGLVGLAVESVSSVSWLPIVAMTVTSGIATSLLQLVESYQTKKKREKGIIGNPVFVRVSSEKEALAASNPEANADKIYWWPEVDASKGTQC